MFDPDALLRCREEVLDRHLLGAVDNVLDHGARVEVLEVEDVLVTIGIGDLQEPVGVNLGVHPLDRRLNHRLDGPLRRLTVLGQVELVQRQVRSEVLAEDVTGALGIGTLDLDLHVEPARSQDRGVDHVFTVGGTNNDDVLEPLDTIDLGQQLRHDRGLHI